jgi:hypothetical protein
LREKYKSIFGEGRTNLEKTNPFEGCFQLLGFDFMVDSSEKVRKFDSDFVFTKEL